MLSAACPGQHLVQGLLPSADVLATLHCLQAIGLGVDTTSGMEALHLASPVQWQEPDNVLDCQNAGTALRLLTGWLAAQPFQSVLSGDASLRRRPMGRVLTPLQQMGGQCYGRANDTMAPVVIRPARGGLHGLEFFSPTSSAQVKSALLFAGLYAQQPVSITEPVASRDHTECMLRGLGVDITTENRPDGSARIVLAPGQIERLRQAGGQVWNIPGDPSSAAFLAVAATLLPGSDLRLTGVNLNPTRLGLVRALQRIGADIQFENVRHDMGEPVGDWRVRSVSGLKGNLTLTAAEVPAMIDEVPILAVAAVFLEGTLTLTGAQELRVKESDRIEALALEFGKLGIAMVTHADGFTLMGQPGRRLQPPPLQGLDAHHDHRMAMALTVLNLAAGDAWWPLTGQGWVAVSFPGFFEQLNTLLHA
jgi:3-phosphoshikimate 1-carboxyvinyltransferase